ncbi:MAG TPA: beta-propeller fold lactonase family protein [Terriglobales bacterium]|nr:beta-propeller fold lactonase family protein [Terriglobales bacterium]
MKARVLLALALLAGVTGCASSHAIFLYATGAGTNEVFGFQVHSDGHITALGQPTFGTGSNPVAMAVHSPGDFFYIANFSGNNLTLLNINKGNGELTVPPTNAAVPPSPLAPPNIFATGAGPVSIAVAPNAPHVYVLNQVSGDISAFLLDPSTGNLSLITNPPGNGAGATTSYGSFTSPSSMAISPQGDVLFVSSPSQSAIFAFAVNSNDGSLAPVAGSPFAVGANSTPTGLAVHPSGHFLYAADGAHNAVLAFTVQNGALSPISGSPFTAGTQPSALVTDPAGTELFVANAGSNDVSAFVIDANSGAIGQLSGSPFPTGGRGPGFVAATGAFVYVADQATNDIAAFSIGSKGGLTPVKGSPFSIPVSPAWLSLAKE